MKVTLYNYDPFSQQVQSGVFEFPNNDYGQIIMVEGDVEHWRGVSVWTQVQPEYRKEQRICSWTFHTAMDAAQYEIDRLHQANAKDESRIAWRTGKLNALAQQYLGDRV